jgi:uncharacterized membrane protein
VTVEQPSGGPLRLPPVLAAITAYNVSVFIHVTAVVIGFGATFAESIAFPIVTRTSVRHLPYLHQLQGAINRWLATPALVVVLVTGIYQVSKGNWSFGDFWISATFAILIVLGGLTGAYFVPADRRLGAMAERELAGMPADHEPALADLSAEYQQGMRTEGIVGAVAGLLIIVAIFLMVTKP